jgi:alkaline phosphatase D
MLHTVRLPGLISRRDWLRLVGASVATGAIGCGDNRTGPDGGVLVDLDAGLMPGPIDADHAAVTFEVDTNSAIVSVHAAEPRWVALVLEDSETGTQRASGAVELDPRFGRVARVDLTELEPDRRYRYHLRFDTDTTSQWFEFRTAPASDHDADVHLVFSADIDTDPLFDSNIFATLRDTGADFFVSLGDWPYADNAPGAWTLDEYRARHRAARTDPRLQGWLRTMGVYAIYDDHEARNDWDAKFRVTEAERIANALAVWDEWFPLHGAPPRYRSVRWGANCELFVLDTRLYRSANGDPDGPAKTMLGAEQKAWLLQGLRTSDAAFKLVVTTVPLDFGTTADHWPQFATERAEILAAVTGDDGLGGVPGVLFLSGDQHWFAAHHYDSGIVEYQVGPLARGVRDQPPLAPEVIARAGVYNFGELLITGGASPTATFSARDSDGAALFTETHWLVGQRGDVVI